MAASKGTFALLYSLFRLFGYFPYNWSVGNLKEAQANPRFRSADLKKSVPWVIWSISITVFIIILVLFDIVSAWNTRRGNHLGVETMEFAHLSYDVITSILVIILQIILFLQSDKVAEYMKYILQYQDEITWNKRATVVLVLIVSVMMVLSVAALTTMTVNSYTVMTVICSCFKTCLGAILLTFIGVLYHTNMTFIEWRLVVVFEQYCIKYKQLRCTEKSTVDFKKNSYSETIGASPVKSTPFDSAANPRFAFLPVPNTLHKHHKDSHFNKDYADISVCKTEHEFLRVYEFIILVNRYFGLPLIIAVYWLLLWLLLSTFYITCWGIVGINQRILSVTNLSISVSLTLYIINSTSGVSDQVS